MNVLMTATFGGAGLVLGAEEMRVVSAGAQNLGEVLLVRVQVVFKAAVREAHNAVGVGKTPRPQGRPRRAALRRGAEAVFKADAGCGKGVDMGRADPSHPIAPQVPPQVVAYDNDNVRCFLFHVSSWGGNSRAHLHEGYLVFAPHRQAGFSPFHQHTRHSRNDNPRRVIAHVIM